MVLNGRYHSLGAVPEFINLASIIPNDHDLNHRKDACKKGSVAPLEYSGLPFCVGHRYHVELCEH